MGLISSSNGILIITIIKNLIKNRYIILQFDKDLITIQYLTVGLFNSYGIIICSAFIKK